MGSLRERTRLSGALNDIDIQIHSRLGFDEIMQSALDGFVEALGADAGDIKVADDGAWLIRNSRGLPEDPVGSRLDLADAPVAALTVETRGPVIVSDFANQTEVPYTGFPLRNGLRAAIGVPLIVRDEVIGTLSAWMRAPREFSPGEIDFARRMAASVALALENARLLEAEKSARRQAEETERQLQLELARTQVLLKASDELTSTIDVEELFARLGRVVLEATGISRVFANLIDMGRGLLITKIATGGLRSFTSSVIPLGDLSTTSFRAIQNKRTALLDYDSPDIPERDREIAEANDARYVLFVPLVYHGEILGHISLDEPGHRHEFTPEQVRAVESIAAIAAVAIQNAHQYAREHRIAETLQQALMAPAAEVDGMRVATVYQAASQSARVGGDFYDVIDVGGGKVAVVVGDVSGKGINAAQLTALMRDGVRAYLMESLDPAVCFERLNALAYRFTPIGKFATVFLAVIDLETGEIIYCNGGHPHPIISGPGGQRVLECNSAILGAFETVSFEVAYDRLDLGEVLIAVTDGVTEARNGSELFGQEGLLEAIASMGRIGVEAIPETLLDAVRAYSGGALHDDIVVLCMSRDAD